MRLFKYRYLIAIVLLFGVLGFAGAFTLANNKQESSGRANSSQSHSSDKAHSGTDDKAAAKADLYVDLEADGANPDTLTVPVGKTVQFNSKDGKKHSLSLGSGAGGHEQTGPFRSGEFGADEAWRATFKEAGTYTFHDINNPKINILIVAYKPARQ